MPAATLHYIRSFHCNVDSNCGFLGYDATYDVVRYRNLGGPCCRHGSGRVFNGRHEMEALVEITSFHLINNR